MNQKTAFTITNTQGKSPWWASRSIVNQVKRPPTMRFKVKYSKQRIRSSTFEKHTFFPGNEINRLRINESDRFLFPTDSYLKALWDASIMLLALILAFIVPYSLSYYQDLNLSNFYSSVNIIFFFDILVQINTSYSDRGHIIVSRAAIIRNYFFSWFFFDLAACLPLEILLPSMGFSEFNSASILSPPNPQRYLWMLKVFKVFRVFSVVYKIKYLYAYQTIFSFCELFTPLLILCLSVHWIACLHNILFINSNEKGQNFGYGWDTTKTKHLRFMERAMQTITTVGYGDTNITTVPERLNASLLMILTSGLMGYFVGGVRSSISKSNESDNYFRDIMMKFKKYSSLKNLTPGIRSKVLNYYRHLKELSKNNVLDERELLNIISMPLRGQIGLYVRGYILTKVTLFNKYSKGCVKALGDKMKIFIFSPSDLIIKQGELTDSMYFILSGNVEIFHEQTKTVFTELGEGNEFGEISFFTGETRKASIKAVQYTEVLALQRYDFIRVTNSLPKDKDVTEIMLRNYKVYGMVILAVRCYFCEEIGHVAKDCPEYSVQVPLSRIIFRYRNQRNKEIAQKFVRPEFDAQSKVLRTNFYSIMNTKGKEDVGGGKVETSLTKIIKKDYWNLYGKKRFSRYMSSSDSESEEEVKRIGKNEKISNRGRALRSSTVLVSVADIHKNEIISDINNN